MNKNYCFKTKGINKGFLLLGMLFFFTFLFINLVECGGKGKGGSKQGNPVDLFQNSGEHFRIYADKYWGWKIQPNSLLKIYTPFKTNDIDCFEIQSSKKLFIPTKTPDEFSKFYNFILNLKSNSEVIQPCEDEIKEEMKDFINDLPISSDLKNQLLSALDGTIIAGPETAYYLELIHHQFYDAIESKIISNEISNLETDLYSQIRSDNLLYNFYNYGLADPFYKIYDYPSDFSYISSYSSYEYYKSSLSIAHSPLDPLRYYINEEYPEYLDSILPLLTGNPEQDKQTFLNYLRVELLNNGEENIGGIIGTADSDLNKLYNLKEQYEAIIYLEKRYDLLNVGLDKIYPPIIIDQYKEMLKETDPKTYMDPQEYHEHVEKWNDELFSNNEYYKRAGGCGGSGQPLCAT